MAILHNADEVAGDRDDARLSVVPGVTMACRLSHAVAPRGSRQNCNDAGFSGPDHAIYTVPPASTANPGIDPWPIVNAPAAGAATRARATTSATMKGKRLFVIESVAVPFEGHHRTGT